MSGLGLASWLCWPQLGGLSPLATQTVNYFLSRSVPAASQAGPAAPLPSPMLGVGLGWQEAVVPRRWVCWFLVAGCSLARNKEEEETEGTKH